MASKQLRSTFFMGLALILNLALAPTPSLARSQAPAAPVDTGLMQFARLVANGQDLVTGVFVVNRFSFPVVQQPEGESGFVSDHDNVITEFGMAADHENIGLLAHNYLAGKRFFDLVIGDRIYLVYGTGRIETFVVTRKLRYQALDPFNQYSQFRTLDGAETISSTEMFNRAYGGSFHLTFQTCIERDGNSSWGRLFIIAEPD